MVAVIWIGVCFVTAPSATASTPKERKLAKQLDALRTKYATVQDQRDTALKQNTQLRTYLDAAGKQIAQLTVDNGNLRAGLPNAILAVPVADFYRLVFTPARQAWRCDTLYQGTGYWSLSFDSDC